MTPQRASPNSITLHLSLLCGHIPLLLGDVLIGWNERVRLVAPPVVNTLQQTVAILVHLVPILLQHVDTRAGRDRTG